MQKFKQIKFNNHFLSGQSIQRLYSWRFTKKIRFHLQRRKRSRRYNRVVQIQRFNLC